jgi:hypothetical protein
MTFPRVAAPVFAFLLGSACTRMREPPAHATLRSRSVEVILDGLRPTLVADLRVEVIGGIDGCHYDLGPAFASRSADPETHERAWRCSGDPCSIAVDPTSELYPLEVRHLLDTLTGIDGLVWPLEVRFEVREHSPDGGVRVLEATEPVMLEEPCRRLGQVPIGVRRIARDGGGAEGELTVESITVVGGCEGPVLHAELSHRVLTLAGTRPVVRVAVDVPGLTGIACRGPHCEVPLDPPGRGGVVIDKPLGASLAALGRPAARVNLHVFLARTPEGGDLPPPGAERPIDHLVYEVVSPGAGFLDR